MHATARKTSWIALIAIVFFAITATAAEPAKPHIVYIVADDLGWKDVGFHGSDIRTPNIDRLAQTGARLKQLYARPMCTPTRAALMTGRYPFRYGLQTAVIPSMEKPLLLQAEFGAMRERLHMPPALPGEELSSRRQANFWGASPAFVAFGTSTRVCSRCLHRASTWNHGQFTGGLGHEPSPVKARS